MAKIRETDYQVIKSINLVIFEEQVRAAQKEGWGCVGGLTIHEKWGCVQAMVKR
jgi:hypothetical protein